MNVYQKLNAARAKFHSIELKKSGHNKFAGYKYFELGDFIIPALEIFKEFGLTGIISFGKETADLRIVNNEKPEEVIVIESPMSSAALKGCHEVQNLGAVQTYIRRYLWVAALEIVEHDAIDASEGAEPKTKGSTQKPTSKPDPAQEVINGVKAGDASGAATYLAGLSESAMNAIWAKLPADIQDKLTAAWPA